MEFEIAIEPGQVYQDLNGRLRTMRLLRVIGFEDDHYVSLFAWYPDAENLNGRTVRVRYDRLLDQNRYRPVEISEH